MERAIAYIRVSDQRQADDGSSLATQEKQVLTYANSKGYAFQRLFREEGESAKTDLRPRLQDLLTYCKTNASKVDVLVVPKIDRLARNAHDYANLKLCLTRYGVRLESVSERIEDTPVGRFTETIMASVAQFDNEVRSERCKGGMIEAVTQGRWVWKAPKGYRNVRFNGKGTIEPDPTTGAIIAKAFDMLVSGREAPSRVRDWMQENGINLPGHTFHNLIANPIYVGKIKAFGQTFDAKPPFVPLVSEDAFYGARAALRGQARTRDWKRDREDFPLRGTLRCQCGAIMTAQWSSGRTTKYSHYRCMSCPKTNLPTGDVMENFKMELGLYRPTAEAWSRICCSILKIDAEQRATQQNQAAVRKGRLEEILKLQKAIALKNATGIIPDAIAKAQIDELVEEEATIRGEAKHPTVEGDIRKLLEFAFELLNDLGGHFHRASLQKKKALLRFMFPHGVIYDRNKGFQTSDYPLLEQIKAEFRASISILVDQGFEFSNSVPSVGANAQDLSRWLKQLMETYEESFDDNQ